MILILCLSFVLSGCQPGTSTTTQPSGTTTKQRTTRLRRQPEQAASRHRLPANCRLSLTEQQPCVSLYVSHQNVVDYKTNYATLWFEEKTGVKIDWMLNSSADSTKS
jgi:hypothetical protein